VACRFAALFITTLTLSACSSSTAPSVDVRFSTQDLVVGSGPVAQNGDDLAVHYTGWIYDPNASGNKGLQFDSSVGSDPFEFRLGAREVIEGWDRGIPGMTPGGTRRLVIPPDLGYGSTPVGPIPANSTLVFEVTLLSIS
jgi:FKBP-type peptidyl-prolyl cis-trans isomerase FkpA